MQRSKTAFKARHSGRLALLVCMAAGAIGSQVRAAEPGMQPEQNQADFYSSFTFFHKPKAKWVRSIAVSSPAYCSAVQGNVTVTFKAPGMTVVKANCWQQPTNDQPSPWGHDADIAPGLKLDADGHGSFVFHADEFPNGPITVRLYAKDAGNNQDYCELQLYNKGGVHWNQGAPKSAPPAAKGMKLAFADDFTGPLSISKDASGTYWTHWAGGDGSSWPFGENSGPHNPFGQVGTYLRIQASKPEGTRGVTGSITPVHPHSGKPGITVHAPCYMEARFLAQNATGTWPAFWALTQGGKTTDELDMFEGYGINAKDGGIWTVYHATTHFWGQPQPAWAKNKTLGPDGHPFQAHRMVDTMALGGKSSWSTTFHTYGVLVTKTDTVYYLDNIEVLRHPSGKDSATLPMTFILNLAIGGGGWKADLQRYGNQSDMWVDYVRMYQGK